jgi:hypothetical protein
MFSPVFESVGAGRSPNKQWNRLRSRIRPAAGVQADMARGAQSVVEYTYLFALPKDAIPA